MTRIRRQPRSSTKIWKPGDSAGQTFTGYNHISVIDTVPGQEDRIREVPPKFWVYYDSLPYNARAAFDQAPNGPAAMILWDAILEKYPYDRNTGKWVGAK